MACVIVLKGGGADSTRALLWGALDSWASPQIAATLYLTDPDFDAQAERALQEEGAPKGREALQELTLGLEGSRALSWADSMSKALELP